MKLKIKAPEIEIAPLVHFLEKELNSPHFLPLKHNLENDLFYPNLDKDLTSFLQNGIVPKDLKQNIFSYHGYERKNFQLDTLLFTIRFKFIHQFGFVLLTENLISTLSEQLKDKNVVELGAGTGWLSKNLQDNNINITPVDFNIESNDYGFKHYHTKIIQQNAIEYLKNNPQHDTIILSWPNYESDFASQVLKVLKPGQKLYYVGEGFGGCTGNDKFFELLETKAIINEKLTNSLEKEQTSWSSIHDCWTVYDIIKPVKKPKITSYQI